MTFSVEQSKVKKSKTILPKDVNFYFTKHGITLQAMKNYIYERARYFTSGGETLHVDWIDNYTYTLVGLQYIHVRRIIK